MTVPVYPTDAVPFEPAQNVVIDEDTLLETLAEMTEIKIGDDIAISEVAASLIRRGYLQPEWLQTGYPCTIREIEEQAFAVVEEAGEVASHMRRIRQGVIDANPARIGVETIDCMIASINLAVRACGLWTAKVARDKMAADEKRGWRHNKGAAADTETVNRRAAELSGVPYEGATTPDAMAAEILRLHAVIDGMRPALSD